MSGERAIVVGAGIGGLVTALELRRRGVEVTLLERRREVGGKMRVVEVDGRPIASGPTVLTMRWVFDQVFEAQGERLDHHLHLIPAKLLARHAFADGQRLDLHADREASAQAIEALAGRDEAHAFRRFSAEAARIYAFVREPFLLGDRPTLSSIVRGFGWSAPVRLTQIDGLRSLWRALGSYFRDPRLVQLFGRYATYVGSSPYTAPATLSLIAHVESEGVHYVQGGMQELARALAALAKDRGINVLVNAPVAKVELEGGRAQGVVLEDGRHLRSDVVVLNTDVRAVTGGLLGPALTEATSCPEERSLSALTWSAVARPRGFPLVRHNVFFSANYRAEFDALERGQMPSDPTVYVCAEDRQDDSVTPEGAERLFILVNAPPRPTGFDAEEISRCETQMRWRLAQAGLELLELRSQVTTPADFAQLFPGSQGSLYGAATSSPWSSFRRPGSRTTIPGLYLAGGSVHPGPGVPMAALSGLNCARLIEEDRPSMWRSPPGATPGGTSTSKATMADGP